MAQSEDDDSQLGGLFDGFEAYRSPTDADYSRLLTSGLVVPDTNVLLNLYRYRNETRDDLFSVLRGLGEHLWLPHQVMTEFWRNRETVLLDPRDTSDTVDSLTEQRDEAVRTLRTWANRVSLPADHKEELAATLTQAFKSVIDGVSELADEDSIRFARKTQEDPVLAELEPILQGRVGRPLESKEHDDAIQEAERRQQKKQPPGFKDKGPGDYLVWVQILREAAHSGKDVLLVTGDVKEDWWRHEHGELRGPRPELAEEMLREAQVHLFMLRPDSLVLHAREVLSVTVRDESVEDIERVERLVAEEETGGWSVESMNELLERLGDEGWEAQETTILRAARNGGFIDRDAVYEIAGYGTERSLRGFTRPVRRITRHLKADKRIPTSAVDLLTADYSSTEGPPGWAAGFNVPRALVSLISEVRSLYYDYDDEDEPTQPDTLGEDPAS